MTNNLADRDAYIIVGVDEEKDYCFTYQYNECGDE